MSPSGWRSTPGTCAASSAWPSVSTWAAISPVMASTLTCRSSQRRRPWPCLAAHHSPCANNSRPVLSRTRCMGPLLARTRGCRPAKARPRRDRVERSGTCSSSPSSASNAAGERFGLTQGQVEHQAQGQHQLDWKIGLAVLTTGRDAPGCRPARQRVFVQPQCQVAAPAQASFVGRPVRDLVAGSGKAVAAGSVVLERHDRNLPSLPRTGYPGIHAPMPRRTGSDGRSSG